MTENGLTKEERQCLQLWFRQAIARVEHEEVTAQFIKNHGINTNSNHHRNDLIRRRLRRNRQSTHARELVT